MSINQVVLTGRLTKDTELRATTTGTPVTNFTIAVDDYNGNSQETSTYFIECIAWNNQAKFVSTYCNKGTPVAVSGRITTRSYDRKDGTKAYVTEVVCNNIQSFGTKKDTAKVENDAPANDNKVLEYDDNDLPF